MKAKIQLLGGTLFGDFIFWSKLRLNRIKVRLKVIENELPLHLVVLIIKNYKQ